MGGRACLAAVALLFMSGCGHPALAPESCAGDEECPVHQYCDAVAQRCVTGCVTAASCDWRQRCDAHGHCLDPPGSDMGVGGGPDELPPDLLRLDGAGVE